MNYDRLRRKSATFRQFTGLSVTEFDKLLAQLEPALAARTAKARRARSPTRKAGAGRKPKLTVPDRLFVTLIYYRVSVSRAFLGGLFDVDAGTVCRLVTAVGLALTGIVRIPERKVRIGEDELRAAFVDATEQPTNRPSRKQRRHYSGKKKRHTIKHQVVVVRKKKRGRGKRKVRVAAVGKAAPGQTHDKRMYDRSRLEWPAGVPGRATAGTRGRTWRCRSGSRAGGR